MFSVPVLRFMFLLLGFTTRNLALESEESGAAAVVPSETEESLPVLSASCGDEVEVVVGDKIEENSETPSPPKGNEKIDEIPLVVTVTSPLNQRSKIPRLEFDSRVSTSRQSPTPLAAEQVLLENINQNILEEIRRERRPLPWIKVPDYEYEVYSAEEAPLNRVVTLSQLKSTPRQILPPFQFINPNTNSHSFVGMPLLQATEKRKMPKYPHSYAILQPISEPGVPSLPLPILRARRPTEPVQVHPIPIPITTTAPEDKPATSPPRNTLQKRSIPPGVTWNQWHPRTGILSRNTAIRGPAYTIIRREHLQTIPRPPFQVPPQPLPQPRPMMPMSPIPYVRQSLVNSPYPEQPGLSNFNTAPQGAPPAYLPRSYGQGHNEPWITSFQPNPQFQRGSNDNSPPSPKYAQGIGNWPQTFIPPTQRQGPSPTFRFSPPTQPQVQSGFKEPPPWLNRPANPIPRYSPSPPQTFIPYQQQQRPFNQFNFQSSPRGPSHNNVQHPVQGGRAFKPSSTASEPSEPVPGNGNGEPENTLVNPFTYFRSHGPVSNPGAGNLKQTVSHTAVNPVVNEPATHGSDNNGASRPEPIVKTHAPARFQQHRPQYQPPTVNQGAQTTTISVLSESRRPVPFYSQADVDSHYRRMLAHNETKKDKEFENDNELLQWDIQRAKQVLRHHHSQTNGSSKGYKQSSSAESTPGIKDGSNGRHQQEQHTPAAPRPFPDTYTSSLGSNSDSGAPRTNGFPGVDSGSGPGRQGHGNDSGYVFNGTAIHPNGGIVRIPNEHHGRHSVPRHVSAYLADMNNMQHDK